MRVAVANRSPLAFADQRLLDSRGSALAAAPVGSGVWGAAALPDPFGGTQARRWTSNNAASVNNRTLFGAGLGFENAVGWRCASIFCRDLDTAFVVMVWAGVGALTCSFSLSAETAAVNTSAGISQVGAQIEPWGSGWFRLSMFGLFSGTGSNTFVLNFCPSNVSGLQTSAVPVGQGGTFAYPQFSHANWPTNPVLTSGVAAPASCVNQAIGRVAVSGRVAP